MKKAASGGDRKPMTVESYLAAVPEPTRSTLERVRAAIRSAAPVDATEAISYQMPAFRYRGGLVAYAAFKKHCSLFPMSLAVMRELSDDLARFETDKGTIRFPHDKPLPAALIRKIVRARVAENRRRKPDS